jgi:hypothetical protein
VLGDFAFDRVKLVDHAAADSPCVDAHVVLDAARRLYRLAEHELPRLHEEAARLLAEVVQTSQLVGDLQ